MAHLRIPFESQALRRHLLEDVVGFWLRHSPDGSGGFNHCLARDGQPTRPTRHLVTHARLIYSFAEAHRYASADVQAQLATRIHEATVYLDERFRDGKQQGWFWSISAAGDPVEREKRAYGHTFVAYALSVAAEALADAELQSAAQEAYSFLRDKFSDRRHGGVHEQFTRDWRLGSDYKTLSTHLHVVEATLEQCRLLGDRGPQEDLVSLCETFLRRIYDAGLGCAGEKFATDWSPTNEAPWVGHNLEAAWFLLQIAGLLGRPTYGETAIRLIDWSLANGWDDALGAFHYKSTASGRVADPAKSWWVETEGLVALLSAWRHTGEPRYFEHAKRLWEFCDAHLIDHQFGEWFSVLTPDGARTSDHKGSAWKGPYHVVQALAACAALLERSGG